MTEQAESPQPQTGIAPVASRAALYLHGAVRGMIGAMAMTGMRNLTSNMGIVDETPPEAIFRQRMPRLLRGLRQRRRKSAIILAHWGYGAVGGAAYAALPEALRLNPWAGPAYGMVAWLGFEAGIAPVLGLSQARRGRTPERIAFAVDHLLYGAVLSETRQRLLS